jgi:hypothetical protein
VRAPRTTMAPDGCMDQSASWARSGPGVPPSPAQTLSVESSGPG